MSVVSEGAQVTYPIPGAAVAPRYEPSIATAGDYLALMKPRVMSLVVFTAFVGMVIAQRLFGFSILYLFIVFAALLIESGFSSHGP